MRTRIAALIAASAFLLLLAAVPSPLAAQTARPTFLFVLEGRGLPTGTIHVFSMDPASGALTEAPGSPFNAGLIPEQLVADPTGRFLYVLNQQSGDITAFSVDASSGTLTELPGSPVPIGAGPVTMAVDPTGRFLYAFAITAVNGTQVENLYQYTIDDVSGVLTAVSSSPTTWESGQGILISSIAFSPAGNFAYLGQVEGGPLGAPMIVCSVDFSTGALTAVGGLQPAAGEADHLAVSPNGGFLYSIDTPFGEADAYSVPFGVGQPTELSGSPDAVGNFPYSIFVHPSGNFLYIANENQPYQTTEAPSQYDGSISAFAVNSSTGALSQVPGGPFAAGINPVSVVVDPSGAFAYTLSTLYTSGYTGFAQILGYSIDSTGALHPFISPAWTDSVQSTGGAMVISTGSATTANPAPAISSLSPPSTVATATPFTLQVNGANLVPGATVYFGGQPRSTAFVSSTQLNAGILASDIDNDGTAVVFVFNPLPGGGASTSVEFPVSALAPVISSISPSSVAAGGVPFELFVSGSNFVFSSVVNFNGAPQPTSYASPSLLTVEISTLQILAQGTANISVTTPSNGVPGGGTSNTVTLTIVPPNVPLLVSSISPASTTAGGAAFTLTVNGAGFVQGSQVSFNLSNVQTTLVSSSQLTASIPAAAIAIAGNPYVIVTNPDGSRSTQLNFSVLNPQPAGGSVSPPSLPAGSSALTLEVAGAAFVQGSVVFVNGNARATTFESSILLQATLLPGDLAQAGTLTITVMNPPPGGGSSGAITFSVADYSVSGPPTAGAPIPAGQTADFTLTVSPSGGAFPGAVTFSVAPAQLPPGAAASFAPSATVTPGTSAKTVTLSISTTPHTSASSTRFPIRPFPGVAPLCLLSILLVLGAGSVLGSGERLRRLAPPLLMLLVLAMFAMVVACGAVGAENATSPQLNPATGTPAGTYSIAVTATSGGDSHSTTVTLTVM